MGLEDQLRQAVARGWCHEKNADKVVDPDLAEAIVAEVVKALAPMHPNAIDAFVKGEIDNGRFWISQLSGPPIRIEDWAERQKAVWATVQGKKRTPEARQRLLDAYHSAECPTCKGKGIVPINR